MLGYNGGNGCIDVLLTYNFKPYWVYKVSVCLLDCIINIICLSAGKSLQWVAEQLESGGL